MESMELIKLISEFGILVVIAGLYLYERFMENRNSSKTLGELKELLEDIKERGEEKKQRELTVYNFCSVLELYLTSQLTELVKEMDELVLVNNVHNDEEKTVRKVENIVRVAHKRHRDYINELTYKGKRFADFIDDEELISEKIQICADYVLSEDPKPSKLWRQLNSLFEKFKLSTESDIT